MKRAMTYSMAALAMMAVAACSSEPNVAAKSEPAKMVELAGVNLDQPLSVLGNEPFWSIRIADGVASYSDPEMLEGPSAPLGQPQFMGNTAVWKANLSDQTPLIITLTGTDCSDGMSDRTYPLAAKVEMGQRVLSGCAASTEAISRAGEAGRVE